MRTDPGTDSDEALHAAIAEASAAARRSAVPEPVSLDWARSALEAHYGLTGTVAAVPARSEIRFTVELVGGSAGDFEVSAPQPDLQVVDFQAQALLHVARVDPGLRVPRLVAAREGAPWLPLADELGRPRAVRLSCPPGGLPMRTAGAPAHAGVAGTLARLDRALANLWHVAGEKELPGDIQRADRVRALLDLVPVAAHQVLAHRALDTFEQRAKGVLPGLRRQPLHNGFGPDTLLVDPAMPGEITGILDFGGMVEAPLVCGLAGAASWQFGGGDPGADADPLMTMAMFAAAYHRVSRLQEIEMALLLDLVRARLAMDLAIGSWRVARAASDAGDLILHNTMAGQRLELIASFSTQQAHDAIAQACRSAEK